MQKRISRAFFRLEKSLGVCCSPGVRPSSYPQTPTHTHGPAPFHSPTQGEAFGYILDFTGGVTASLTSFVLPAFIYLKGSEQQPPGEEGRRGYRLASKILLVFGAALILVVLISILHNSFATVVVSAVVFGGLFSARATLLAP